MLLVLNAVVISPKDLLKINDRSRFGG